MPATDAPSLRPWLAQLAAGGRLVEIAEELDPADGLAARLVAHDREPVRVARVRGSDLPVVANLLPSRALIAEALGVAEHELGAQLQRALDAPLEPRIVAAGGLPGGRRGATRPGTAADPALLRARGRAVHHGRLHRRARSRDGRAQLVDRARAAARRLARARRHRAQPPPRRGGARRARARRAPADRRDDRQPPGAAGRRLPLPRPRRGRAARRRRAARRARRARRAARRSRSRCPRAARSCSRASSTWTRRVEEGPVSEFHGGYERYGRAATATFRCLTRRRDALYQAILPGFHPEHALLGGVAIAAGLERKLRGAVPVGARRRRARERRRAPGGGRRARAARARRGARASRWPRSRPSTSSSSSPSSTTTSTPGTTPRSHTRSPRACIFDRDLHVLPAMRADRAEPLERGGHDREARDRRDPPRRRSRRLDARGAAADEARRRQRRRTTSSRAASSRAEPS